MKMFLKGATALGIVLALGVASAPAAFAKAHGSGVSNDPSPPQGGRSTGSPHGAEGLGKPETSGAARGGALSDAAKSGEPGFSEGKGTFGDSTPGFGGGGGGNSGRGEGNR